MSIEHTRNYRHRCMKALSRRVYPVLDYNVRHEFIVLQTQNIHKQTVNDFGESFDDGP